MAFIDRIFDILGIRRIVLDKPLTLLGQDSGRVLNKISASRDFGWEEDIDWEIRYTRNDEEDRNVHVCQWETVKIIHTFKFDESEKIVSAGRIYIDKDEAFLEDIIRKVTSGKRRAYGKINYRHFGLHDPDDEMYYHYDDKVYLMIYKESCEFDHGHSLRVEYVLKDIPEDFSCNEWGRGGKKARTRTIGEDRQRILEDIKNHINL